MQLPRVRFTVRSLIIAVALVALDLAAVIATPRVNFARGGYFSHGLIHSDERREYGVACTYGRPVTGTNLRSLENLARIVAVGRGLEPTVLQVWSRVIASSSITLLAIFASLWDWGTLQRSIPTQTDGDALRRRRRGWLAARLMSIIIATFAITLIGAVFWPIADRDRVAIVGLVLVVFVWDWGAILPRLWPAARWVLLVVALIAMNLAGAAFPPSFTLYEPSWSNLLPRPPRGFGICFAGDFSPLPPLPPQPIEPPPGTRLDLNYSDLFEGLPRVLNLSVDGTLVQRSPMEVILSEAKWLPDVLFQDAPIGEATIDFRADGRVVGYVGRPGKMLSAPRLLRPPSYSFLEMRWPIIASMSITLLILVVLVRRLNPRQVRTLFIVLALSVINLAGVLAYFARERPRLLSATWGHAEGSEEYYSDGSRHFYVGGVGSPRRLTRIERPNPPLNFLQTDWPIIASPSITLLVLVLWWRRFQMTAPDSTSRLCIGEPAEMTDPNGQEMHTAGR